MNRLLSQILFIFTLLIVGQPNIHAQVTIGSLIPPVEGALLDLKENNSTGENATKGLLMPRVALEKEKELDPCVSGITNANEKLQHTGLFLYNTSTIVSENLCPGLYYWEGVQWKRLYGSCPKVSPEITIKNLKSSYVTDGLQWTFDVESTSKWVAVVENSQGVINGTLSALKGDGDMEVVFTTDVVTTNNTDSPEYIFSKVTFASEDGSVIKEVTIKGEKMYIKAPATIEHDADGYTLSGTPTTQIAYSSNSTRPLTIDASKLAFAKVKNNILDVAINNSRTARQGTILVSNGGMNKSILVKQQALIFDYRQTSKTISADEQKIDIELIYQNSSRRTITHNPGAAWLSVNRPNAVDPNLTASQNTGAERNGIVVSRLEGQVYGKASVDYVNTSPLMIKQQETPSKPKPIPGYMYFLTYSVAHVNGGYNTSGVFDIRHDLARGVAVVPYGKFPNGDRINFTYVGHSPINGVVKTGEFTYTEDNGYKHYNVPTFDLNTNCQISYVDQYGNKYEVVIYLTQQ